MRDRKAVVHAPKSGHSDTKHLSNAPHVAIVGAGIAGLSAATALAERGIKVTVLERENYLGGRVGGWRTTLADGNRVSMNRGFHAFFRQYYNLRNVLSRFDPSLRCLTALEDYPLVHADGYRDTFAGLPRTPPWNAFAFVARSPTFTWRDMLGLQARPALPLAQVSVPRTYHQLDHMDAASFLDSIRFPHAAKHLAFEVFSRSFFADPSRLSAAELATMFHIYFLGSSEGLLFDVAADCFPIAFWHPLGDYLRARGVQIRTESTVEGIERLAPKRFRVHQRDDCLDVDGIVLATDVQGLRDIAKHSPHLANEDWRTNVANLHTADPFLVTRLWLDRPVRGDRPGFLGTSGFGPLDNISVLERYENQARQWAQRNSGSVVELHAYALASNTEHTRDQLLRELHRVYPETAGARIVDERSELRGDCPLFAPNSFTSRPGVNTPESGMVLAGDHVRIDLPVALMERAATTGLHAANILLADWNIRGHPLWTVPVHGRFAPLRALRA